MERTLPECESGKYWEVHPGDTIYLIAAETGTTVQDILRLNPNIDPNNMQIGTFLCLPPPTGIPIGPIPPCESGLYWVVGPGDTLFTIARDLAISVEQLLDLNPSIDPLNLQPGMSLCLPRVF